MSGLGKHGGKILIIILVLLLFLLFLEASGIRTISYLIPK
jgi:hypothetical protein